MLTETEKRQLLLIHAFGSVEAYQEKIFDKLPPIYIMICDEQGNVTYDEVSIGRYLEREMNEHAMSLDQIIERDKKTFAKIIDDFYHETFGYGFMF